MISTEKIQEILDDLSEDNKYFLVDFKVSSSKIKQKVTVLVDTDKGIGIDECSQISREIGKILDEEIDIAYTLEVSSPGLEHPLKLLRQYQKNIGRELVVLNIDGSEVKGELLEIVDESILIQRTKKKKDKTLPEKVQLAFKEIKEAKVQVSFR